MQGRSGVFAKVSDQQLLEDAKSVLAQNDRGGWTMPAADLYPHQWLWDSCFIAIGLRHTNLERAKTELISLQRGQWANGMMPDMIFSGISSRLDEVLWDSALSPNAPANVATSGITQPPMLAEAVYLVGQKLKLPERRSWYKQMLPTIIYFHEWLYRERDPNGDGLVVLIHPYESGMDNSPPWIDEMYSSGIPPCVKLVSQLKLDFIINHIRRDTRHVAAAQRMSTAEVLSLFVALRRLRRKSYDSKKILQKPYLALHDLAFNSIFVRSNSCLKEIAKTAGVKLPKPLLDSMQCSHAALETLWSETEGCYYSRSFRTGQPIREPSIAGLLPLYSGAISNDRAARLVELLGKQGHFKTTWPVPSVPMSSSYFDPLRYWQGPSWISTNWLIIQGLKRYGYDKEAQALAKRTLELTAKSGFSEYYDPHTGDPHGAKHFSWSAALTIDLLKS